MLAVAVAVQAVVVVDRADGTPVAGAALVERNGVIAAITDADGVAKVRNWPVTVRSLGFKPITVETPADTVWLEYQNYELGGFTVDAAERPVCRVVYFITELCTSITDSDTIINYTELMGQTFGSDSVKVKGFSQLSRRLKVLNAAHVVNVRGTDGSDSVYVPKHSEAESFADMLVYHPRERVKEPEEMRNGALTHEVPGKYAPELIYRKSDSRFVIANDALANYKDHKWSPWFFKLMGCTVDFTELLKTEVHAPNASGTYGMTDYLYSTVSGKFLARGKWLKKMANSKTPVEMNCYIAVYPVEVTYISVDEYKQLDRNAELMPWAKSALVPEREAVIDDMISRARAVKFRN